VTLRRTGTFELTQMELQLLNLRWIFLWDRKWQSFYHPLFRHLLWNLR